MQRAIKTTQLRHIAAILPGHPFRGTIISTPCADTHAVQVRDVNEFGVIRNEPGAVEYIDDEIDLFEKRGINYAIWHWFPSWELYTEEVHDFNFQMGTDIDNRDDIGSNPFLKVLEKYWSLNELRPSDVAFVQGEEGG